MKQWWFPQREHAGFEEPIQTLTFKRNDVRRRPEPSGPDEDVRKEMPDMTQDIQQSGQ